MKYRSMPCRCPKWTFPDRTIWQTGMRVVLARRWLAEDVRSKDVVMSCEKLFES